MRFLLLTLIVSVHFTFAIAAETKTHPEAPKKVKPPVVLKMTADRKDSIYQLGETVTFTVTATREGSELPAGKIFYTIDDFGSNVIKKGNLPLSKDPQTLSAKMTNSPGFMRCRIVYYNENKKASSKTLAVAISPLEIKPSMDVPEDFDLFWKTQKEKLAEVKPESKLTEIKSKDANIVAYDVQFASLGKPVSGYFAKQKDAKLKSCPIVLSVHGAGVRSSSIHNAMRGAKAGMLSMDINAHGIPNGQPLEYYSKLSKSELKNYRHEGREDRETVYFKGMFLRIVRAIDFLTSQPEWDGKSVCVIGSSQGGAQALVAGGLDPRVTFIAAGVPAMCDHTGCVISRVSGWPRIVPVDKQGQADMKIANVAQYYDAVNFATRCSKEAIVSVGFIDRTCPPTSCYAAYNQLRGKKSVLNRPFMGHANPADVQKAFWDALVKHTKR